MNAREIGLQGYYLATSPMRSMYRRQLSRQGRSPLCVLFYHRVADCHTNGWSISNNEFERQMRWIKRNVEVVSLKEIQRRMESKHNNSVAVAITFDDGYAENCDRAIPFLLENEIPATYFVSLDFVVNDRPFPQDVQQGIPLRPNTPDQLREIAAAGIEIGAHTRTHCDVGKIGDAETLYDEIITATDELSSLVNQPIRYFAFPYGRPSNLSAAACKLAKTLGMVGVCSADGAYNFAGDDSFHIQRIHGDPSFVRLKNWLTVDPRKISHGRDFVMQQSAVHEADIKALETNSGTVPAITFPDSSTINTSAVG